MMKIISSVPIDLTFKRAEDISSYEFANNERNLRHISFLVQSVFHLFSCRAYINPFQCFRTGFPPFHGTQAKGKEAKLA
jgi:hypothetical protein